MTIYRNMIGRAIHYLSIVVLSMCGYSVFAQSDASKTDIDYHLDFREANTLVGQQSDYTSALEKYHSIENSRGLSENLAFNIATCYYKTQQLGMARLYLERALLMDPHNPDVQNNLRVLLKKLNLEEPEPTPLEAIALKMKSDVWLWLGYALLTLPFAIVFTNRVYRSLKGRRQRITVTTWVTSSTILVISLSFIYLSHQKATLSNCGIVIAPEATLRQSPFDQADAIATVREGKKIHITQTHSDFFLCQDNNSGMRGWVSKSDCVAILSN